MPQLCSMVHRGELLRKAIDESGYPISQLAKRLGKSRKWMYLQFDNPSVQIDYMIEIGKLLHVDFSKDLNTYQLNETPDKVKEPGTTYAINETEYWKAKYIDLLERYNKLLELKIA